MLTYNPILDTDSYKISHHLLYPPELEHVFSYAEARGGRYPSTLFFGLQPFVKRLVENPIRHAHIEEAADFAAAHGEPFNAKGWYHILDRHDGFLPLEINAVPEGLVVPTRNVLCTVENTDPDTPWLTSYVETALLRQVWYAVTVATRIFNMKKRLKKVFEATADDLSALPFALLDFSSRGCSGLDANMVGGAAYLSMFLGSDSVPAVRYVNHYYGAEGGMSGFSIPASEHSVTTSWGPGQRELARMEAFIAAAPEGAVISDVVDTWNCFEATRLWTILRHQLEARRQTIVIRPDSGDIETVVPELLRIMAKGFGTTKNRKGFDVLNGSKLLWGDGINEETHMLPFQKAWDMGISAASITTGSGGGLMQNDINRDTCKFAFKASGIKDTIYGYQGVAKNPITDIGKMSKMGRQALVIGQNGYETVSYNNPPKRPDNDLLRPVYRNGDLLNMETIDVIRQRIDAQL